MPRKHKIILDTDPGVDDVLALLLALAASPDEIEILLISVTEGNVDVKSCLRNVVALFHVLEKELRWREAKGYPLGFETARTFSPIVAVGADAPLHDTVESADYFHGHDGLAGTTITHPHFSPEDTWQHLFDNDTTTNPDTSSEHGTYISSTTFNLSLSTSTKLARFTPSRLPAHEIMLALLRSHEADSITIISIGPLTTLALAAAQDPHIFLRCHEVVSMGGSIVPGIGNVTPLAEFNVFADPYAAARMYALTSPTPSSTMPLHPLSNERYSAQLPAYPPNLPCQLRFILFSLDITEHHVLTAEAFYAATKHLLGSSPNHNSPPVDDENSSPLASWLTAILEPMFAKCASYNEGSQLALHDPMCIYYLLVPQSHSQSTSSQSSSNNKSSYTSNSDGWEYEEEDIRVETLGQWTRGSTLKDRRKRRRRNSDGEVPHDRGNWRGSRSGNVVRRMVKAPGQKEEDSRCARELLGRLFGDLSSIEQT